jgi:hypothetical protein
VTTHHQGSNALHDTIDLKSKAGNIAILESVDSTNTNQRKHAKADVSLVVQNTVETAVVNARTAISQTARGQRRQ